MFTLIVLIVLVGSFFGVLTVVARKAAVLADVSSESQAGESFFSMNKAKARVLPLVKHLSPEKILLKILLKIQKQIGLWLTRLKNKSKGKAARAFDVYWQELKKLPKTSFRLHIKRRGDDGPTQLKIEAVKKSKRK
ncbi:MAG: hypothetical protein AAB620_02530 [Patescibacteria group bacterium]